MLGRCPPQPAGPLSHTRPERLRGRGPRGPGASAPAGLVRGGRRQGPASICPLITCFGLRVSARLRVQSRPGFLDFLIACRDRVHEMKNFLLCASAVKSPSLRKRRRTGPATAWAGTGDTGDTGEGPGLHFMTSLCPVTSSARSTKPRWLWSPAPLTRSRTPHCLLPAAVCLPLFAASPSRSPGVCTGLTDTGSRARRCPGVWPGHPSCVIIAQSGVEF